MTNRHLKVNYREDAANLQVTPRLPRLSSRSGWQYIGLQHHIQPPIQTPEFQPVQHLLVVHLNAEQGVERHLGGSRQRGDNLPGEITVIPAHCNYQVTTVNQSEVLLLTLEPQYVSYLAYETVPERLEIVPQFAQFDPLIHGIGLTLKTELESNQFEDYLYLESLTNVLAMHLLKRYSHQPDAIQEPHGGLPRYKLRQVLDYIRSHLDREIRVADLASIADLSRYYFASLFKRSTGVTPYQYILMQRVEKAKRLLRQKELSLSEIALACGFANQNHFIRRFRQLKGVTPKYYQDRV